MKVLTVVLAALTFLAGVTMFVLGYVGIFSHNEAYGDVGPVTAEQPDLRALLAAATEGPWRATTCMHRDDQWSHSVVSSPMGQLADTSESLVGEGDDAVLIAAARNELAGILDRLDAVRALLVGWEQGADAWGTCGHEWMSLEQLRAALDGAQ